MAKRKSAEDSIIDYFMHPDLDGMQVRATLAIITRIVNNRFPLAPKKSAKKGATKGKPSPATGKTPAPQTAAEERAGQEALNEINAEAEGKS